MSLPHVKGQPVEDSAHNISGFVSTKFDGVVSNGVVHDKNPDLQDGAKLNGMSTDTIGIPSSINEEYCIRENLMGTKRQMKIIFMGMGCSGISFAYQHERRMENVELVVYEKNEDVGGTWPENRHPGCACDISSVCYQYSWQKQPD